jgi:hypothetical protein
MNDRKRTAENGGAAVLGSALSGLFSDVHVPFQLE